HCDVAARYLPSFPTRRSSDLEPQRFVPGEHRSRAIVVNNVQSDQRPAMGFFEAFAKLLPIGFLDFLRRHNSSLTVLVCLLGAAGDRKSTRLNSSHRTISYAVF